MDIEKTMEFILSVQARLEASAQDHHEQLAKHDEQIAKLESSIASLTDLVGRLAQAEIRLVERMDRMAERMTAGFQELRELQANTEYKLNALIDTVDKLVRGGGQPGIVPPPA
jgi:predicted  nucleic acid-binding Zn-ribbon protein